MAIKPKSYETLYLVRPDINSDELTTIQDKITKAISSGEGEIQKNEKWADRDLAYPINDYTKGSYYILVYKSLPSVPAEIEKHLSFHKTDVLRFMTILSDGESVDAGSKTNADNTATTAPAQEAAPPPKPEPAPAESTPPPAPEPKAETSTSSGFTSANEPAEEPTKESDGGEE